jgi:hypothetical protein
MALCEVTNFNALLQFTVARWINMHIKIMTLSFLALAERVHKQDILCFLTKTEKKSWNLVTYGKKVKQSHNTPMEAQGERIYSSYSFMSLALDGSEWSASRLCRALPGKGPPVPIVQEAGWASEPVWTERLEEKSFRLCRGWNLGSLVVQSVARHYTGWATRLLVTYGTS